jgi:tetratricopeptide (TPR) repeat protein
MKRHSTSRVSRPFPLLAQIALVLGVVVVLSLGIYWVVALFSNQVTVGPAQVNVLELWNSGSYDEILANGKEELKRLPLDPGTLVFSGFAAFHKGVAEVTVEKKLPLINQSIVSLRKALLLPNVPLQPEIHYILGKAYFHKGKFYADLAISHLLKARELGYVASDMNEYLGLAYSLVARFGEASEYFLKAVEKTPSDLLLWTLGQTYFQMQRYDDAVRYLRLSIDKTKDRALEQRCRFLLGEIFTKTKQYPLAQTEYQTILDKNPNSADAHFYLGEIALAQGNKDGARAEWRKAFKIDPLHFNANQRLFN